MVVGDPSGGPYEEILDLQKIALGFCTRARLTPSNFLIDIAYRITCPSVGRISKKFQNKETWHCKSSKERTCLRRLHAFRSCMATIYMRISCMLIVEIN